MVWEQAACPVKLAAKIGTDGLWVLQELRSYGVDTSLVLVDDDKVCSSSQFGC